MAEWGDADRILWMVMHDPRLRERTPAARWIWLEISRAVHCNGVSIHQQEGAAKMCALAAATTEEEAGLALAELLDAGLLRWTPDGLLSSPLLTETR